DRVRTARRAKDVRRRRWPFVVIGALACVLVVAAGAFSWDRWLRYDDAAELQGEWQVHGTAATVVIDGEAINITDDVAYPYAIDAGAKTISYAFGNAQGSGRYRFSLDRSQLVIMDGEGYTCGPRCSTTRPGWRAARWTPCRAARRTRPPEKARRCSTGFTTPRQRRTGARYSGASALAIERWLRADRIVCDVALAPGSPRSTFPRSPRASARVSRRRPSCVCQRRGRHVRRRHGIRRFRMSWSIWSSACARAAPSRGPDRASPTRARCSWEPRVDGRVRRPRPRRGELRRRFGRFAAFRDATRFLNNALPDHMTSAHLTFDTTGDKVAQRVVKMRSSAVRDLFAAASRPDVISLSGGMPDVSLLPQSAIKKAVRAACEDERAVALQYGSTDGRVQTKQVFCDLMRDIGVRAKPENVLITSGAQEALDLISKAFIDPGDIILAEGPTYLARQAFSAYGPTSAASFDDEGMRMTC
ncbi:MAG: hypothetical protein ACLSVD_11055, partial [Eggerthellaceae bacterium]